MNVSTLLKTKLQPPPEPPKEVQKKKSALADTQAIVRRIRIRGQKDANNQYPASSLT
jgi:hypothetical protein